MTADIELLARRVAALETELAIWRAAAVAEDDYANSRAPAGSRAEIALFQRLQSAFQRRAPLRMAAIAAANGRASRSLRQVPLEHPEASLDLGYMGTNVALQDTNVAKEHLAEFTRFPNVMLLSFLKAVFHVAMLPRAFDKNLDGLCHKNQLVAHARKRDDRAGHPDFMHRYRAHCRDQAVNDRTMVVESDRLTMLLPFEVSSELVGPRMGRLGNGQDCPEALSMCAALLIFSDPHGADDSPYRSERLHPACPRARIQLEDLAHRCNRQDGNDRRDITNKPSIHSYPRLFSARRGPTTRGKGKTQYTESSRVESI